MFLAKSGCVSKLAKIQTSAAPACPNCRNRVTDLDLDKLAAGAEHQCLFCGNTMRVPKALLDRLMAERDAARAAQKADSWWARIKNAWLGLWKGR